MSTADHVRSPARVRGETLAVAATAALGAWSIATPYLGNALGLRIDVPSSVEVVDHVVPGVVVLAVSAVWILALARGRSTAGSFPGMVGAGLFFLGALWITLTHVPTLIEAAAGDLSWGPALFHSAAGPLMLGLSLWVLVPQLRGPP